MEGGNIIWYYFVILSVCIAAYNCGVLWIASRVFLIFIGYMITAALWSYIVWLYDDRLNRTAFIIPNNGLPGIMKYTNSHGFSMPSYKHTGNDALDASIEHIILLFIRDFVLYWYEKYFDDIIFPKVAYDNCNLLLHRICDRAKVVPWTSLVAVKINADIATHLKLFITAIKKFDETREGVSGCIHNKIANEFFSLETKVDTLISHKLLCTNPNKEIDFLTFLVESIAFLLFPEIDFDDKIYRYILRDIVVMKVLLPCINILSDPDYINQFAHLWKTDSNYSYDNFINAIRITTCEDDLIELVKCINAEITRLSGNDMISETEEYTKKQISSLTFIKRLSLGQIEAIRFGKKSPSPVRHTRSISEVCVNKNNLPLPGCATETTQRPPSHHDIVKFPKVPVRQLIDNALSFPYLSDFMDERGEMHLLFLFVNIQSIIDSFRSFLESESYKKKAVFFKDSRSLSLRQTILALMKEYEKYFVNSSMRGIDKSLYDEVIKEANFDIPAVEALKQLQDRVIIAIEDPGCIEKFYATTKYERLCVKMELVAENALTRLESCEGPVSSNKKKEKSIVSWGFIYSTQDYTVDAIIIDTFVSSDASKEHIVYVIRVSVYCKDLEESWCINRRFRDFCEFHDALAAKFPQIGMYTFPEKKVFGNKVPELVEKRKTSLSFFLKNLLDCELFKSSKSFFEMMACFLNQGAWNASSMTTVRAEPPFYINLSDGSQTGEHLDNDILDISCKSQPEASYSKLSLKNLDSEEIEQLALSIMVSLVEELFDVRNKTPWLARQIKTFVKDVFIATVGDKLGRKIVDQVDYLVGAEKVTELLNKFRESFWPSNVWAEATPSRSPEIKSRQKIVSCAVMIGLMPYELRRFLGDDVSLDGIFRLFSMLQIKVLNKRLIYCLLETVVEEVFPDNTFAEMFKNFNESCPTSL